MANERTFPACRLRLANGIRPAGDTPFGQADTNYTVSLSIDVCETDHPRYQKVEGATFAADYGSYLLRGIEAALEAGGFAILTDAQQQAEWDAANAARGT